MILAFEFYYLSHNGVLEFLLDEQCQKEGIAHALRKEGDVVTLFVEAEPETLEAFSENLSKVLPLSLFFRSSRVFVADEWPERSIEILPCTVSLPFLPEDLVEGIDPTSLHYAQPVRGFASDKDAIILSLGTQELLHATKPSECVAAYEQIAATILEGGVVCVEGALGRFCMGALEHPLVKEGIAGMEVIATDLSVVERLAVIRDNEIKALVSLERPSIRLKVNAFFAQKGILPTQRVQLRMADSLLMWHVCRLLFDKGVHFLFRAPGHLDASLHVMLKADHKAMEPLEVCVLENGEMVIVQGASYASDALCQTYAKFGEPAYGSLASILQEHLLFDRKVSSFYCSINYDDRFLFYSKEEGVLNLVGFPHPESFEALFASMAQSKSGERLIENYRNTFPEIYAKALATPIPKEAPNNLYTLWCIVAVVLGISETFEAGAKQLIEHAEDFGGKKGPRIDHYLLKEDSLIADFNYLKMIRSGMSFKLAGSDETILSFGYMESLSYFISDSADHHKENFGTEAVALGGALFGYRRLLELVYRNLKPNHMICLNKELPIEYLH